MSSNLNKPLLREGTQPSASSTHGPGPKEPPIAVCVFNQPVDTQQQSAAEKRLEGAPATNQTTPASTPPSSSSSSSASSSKPSDSTKTDASQSTSGPSSSSSKRPPLPRLLSVGASDELINSPQPADSNSSGHSKAEADYARPNVAEDIDRIKREVVNAAHANESAAESAESGRTEQKVAALVEGAAHTVEPQLQEESVSELEKKGRAIVENMVKATIIKPLLVKLDGVHNFRDLSSYPTEIHAKAIRPGVLFRSGMLDLATIQDVDYLQQRLNTIIDLRDPREYAEDLKPQKHRLLRRLHEWRRKKGSPRARPHFFRHRSRRSPTSAAAQGFTPASEPIHETKTEAAVTAPVPQAAAPPTDPQPPAQPAPPAAPPSPVTLLHVKFPVGIEEADPAVKAVSTAQSETAAPDSGVTMFMKHAPAAEPALPHQHHDQQAKNLFQMPLANHHALKKLAWDSASLAEKGKFLLLRFGACRTKESEELMTRVVGRQGLLGYNRVMVLYCHEEVCRVLKLIAVKEHQPIVFHCTHGKDRTGLIAALVLHVLCVPREYIISDYASSAEYIPAKAYEEMLSRPGFTAEQWACCPPLIITKTFELIESTYGSVDAYLDVIGFDRRWRDTMREALLVDEAPDADLGSSDSESSTDDSRPPSAAPTPGLEGSSATPAPNVGPRVSGSAASAAK